MASRMPDTNFDYDSLRAEWKDLIEQERRIRGAKAEIKKRLSSTTKQPPYSRPGSYERSQHMKALYLEGKTLQEIGDLIGVTRQYVGYVLNKIGVTAGDGGASLRPKQTDLICKSDGCTRNALTSGFCSKHYTRIRLYGTDKPELKRNVEHADTCAVYGCKEPFKSRGLCNNHSTVFYVMKRRGAVDDFQDYLRIIKAKRLMRDPRAKYEAARKFIKSNPELFREDGK